MSNALSSHDASSSRTLAAKGKLLFYIFLLALFVRLFFVAFYAWEAGDSAGYDNIARNLLMGNGFSMRSEPPFEPTLYRTPIYPAFLSLLYGIFGFNHIVVYVTQSLIGAATCIIIFLIARRYFDPRIAMLAALFNAFYPLTAAFSATVLTETLFTFLTAIAIYLLVIAYQQRSWRWMAGVGAIMGVAILCRPEVLLYPFFLSFLILAFRFHKASWKMAAALIIFSVLMTVPWLVRNYGITGKVTPLVTYGPGVAFWQSTLTYFDFNTFQYAPGAAERDPIVRDLLSKKQMTPEEQKELEARMWSAGFRNIRRDPLAYFFKRVREYPYLWISSGDFLLGTRNLPFGEARSQRRFELLFAKAALLLITGVLPLALAALGILLSRRRLVGLMPLWSLALYVGVFRIPFDYAPRNTLPVHPYLLVFAAYGALYLWENFARRRAARSTDQGISALTRAKGPTTS